MSFSIDTFGLNQVAEIKAYKMGFSPVKHLSSILRNPEEQVTILTYALPAQEWYLPKAFDIRTRGVTIIAHSNYAEQALAIKRKYPDIRIFLDLRVHAKMTLVSSGQIWIGSANLCNSHSLDGTVALESPALYAFYMDEISRYHLTAPYKEVLLNADVPDFEGIMSTAEEDFAIIDDD